MSKVLVIGGSAGSYKIILDMLRNYPAANKQTILLCMHRLKNLRSGVAEALKVSSRIPVVEPEDKTEIQSSTLYLAPADYHMLISEHHYITLSTDEAVHFSRPSIDFLFISAAEAYGSDATGILLSGANKDGAEGARHLKEKGGKLVIQDPASCEIRMMTEAAMKLTEPDEILSPKQIIDFVYLLNS